MKDELENWKTSDLISDSLWLLGKGYEQGQKPDFYGGFIPAVAEQIIRRFSEPGNLVLDMFAGAGTSGVKSLELGRHWLGIELNRETAEKTQKILDVLDNPKHLLSRVSIADSSSSDAIPVVRVDALLSGQVEADLTILHPPYDSIIKFSDDPRDLSNCARPEDFRLKLFSTMLNAQKLTKDRGYVVMVIGDTFKDGKLVPLSSWAVVDAEETQLVLKAICIKDIQGNEKGKGKNKNLWRYRALKNGLYGFSHEYIIIWRKEPSKVLWKRITK